MAINLKQQQERAHKEFSDMAKQMQEIIPNLGRMMGSAVKEMTPEQKAQTNEECQEALDKFEPKDIMDNAQKSMQDILNNMK